MKNTWKRPLALCLCLCLLLGSFAVAYAADPNSDGGQYSLNLQDYADQWVYNVDESGVAYYSLDVVYCTNPVDPNVQHMVIYAPAVYMQKNADGTVAINSSGVITSSNGVVYTAETAPILYTNTSGGYSSSSTTSKSGSTLNIAYMEMGYVQVAIGTRGKDTTDADGNYIGQFPLIIVDLKAGIRFLKANSSVVPGNTDRIISHGASSGGAVGVMLGASGNSPIFDSYLEEIGAADTTDDIFAVLGYCPITNLDSADAAYEWFQAGNQEYFLFNAMAVDMYGNDISDQITVGRGNFHPFGDNVLGGAHEDELAAMLYQWYVEYIQNLGFDLGDDGRSGAFYTELVDVYSASLTDWLTRYDELDTPDKTAYPTAQDYIQHLYDDYSAADWLELDGTEAVITDYDCFMSNFISRNKMCPSLDSYNYMSNENSAFITSDGTKVHFSTLVRDMLQEMVEEYEDSDYFTEDEYDYIVRLAQAYAQDVTEESAEMLAIMSPVNYIVNDTAYWESTLAPYWRFHVGSADGDHGLPAAWLTHNALLTYAEDEIQKTVVEVSWDQGHGTAEINVQDLYDYIDEIMLVEDDLPVSSFSDVNTADLFYSAVEYVKNAGLMGGVGGGRFAPNDDITSAMMVTVLARLAGADTTTGATWYEASAVWAVENGISDGLNLAAGITRAEAATMLGKFAQMQGWSVDTSTFFNDMTSLDLSAVATRAELAVALMNFCAIVP